MEITADLFASVTVSGDIGAHLDVSAFIDEDGDRPRAALTRLGYPDEDTLAAAIRSGDLDRRGDEVLACLREVVRHRLAIAHPGYDQAETGAP